MSILEEPDPAFLHSLGLIPFGPTTRQSVLAKASPTLRQRVLMMSSGDDADWPRYLTWHSAQADELQLLISVARGCQSEGKLLGYTFLDAETYLAVIEVVVHVLGSVTERPLWITLCLGVNATTSSLEWQLYEINTSSPVVTRPDLRFVSTLDEVKRLVVHSKEPEGPEEPSTVVSDDDYWAQYGDDNETSDLEESSRLPTVSDDDYYGRYANEVETAIQNTTEGTVAEADLNQDSPCPRTDLDSTTTPLLRHVEQSLRSLRELCLASNLSDGQLRAIFDEVMR